jgi:hypothetical protein
MFSFLSFFSFITLFPSFFTCFFVSRHAVFNRLRRERKIACNLNSAPDFWLYHNFVWSVIVQWTETKQETRTHRNVEEDVWFCIQLIVSETNKLNQPCCRLHSLSIEAKGIGFKPPVDTYSVLVSKAIKMARCPGLWKKPMPVFLNLTNRAVYWNTVRGTPSRVLLQSCMCACMKAIGHADSLEVIIKCRLSYDSARPA